MRTIDTYEYVSALKALVEEGHEVCVQISGNSMAPFLRDKRDIAYFKAPDEELKIGDIVFFQRTNGQFVLHRICRIENNCYYILGDNQRMIEGPILREQIFAIVTRVRRKGNIITPSNLIWDFYAKMWSRLVAIRSKMY